MNYIKLKISHREQIIRNEQLLFGTGPEKFE